MVNFLTFAQIHKLNKVTKAQLLEKNHPLEPEAEAAFLFNICNEKLEYNTFSERGFEKITTIKSKIKIYKKDGYKWANLSVPFYSNASGREKIFFNAATTYNLENGKVVKTKLKNKDKFEEKLSRDWSQININFPDVREGSIIEYEYIIISPYIFKLDDWDFQKTIPVNFSELSLIIPEYYIYKAYLRGFFSPKISKNAMQFKRDFNTRDIDGQRTLGKRNSYTLDYSEEQTKYQLKNVPSLKEDIFVNNIDNYKSTISHELAVYIPGNAPIQSFSLDWDQVIKRIYESKSFGNELIKAGYFENDLNKILAEKNSKDERIIAIFEYVKSKAKWNGNNSHICEMGVEKAFKTNTGNVADINLMLTKMLRYAGYDANPVLLSTRSNGIAIYPTHSAFNYVISAVEIDNALILLDATEPFSTPNVLPIRNLNWFGKIIRKNGSLDNVDLMPKEISTTNINLMAELTSDGKLSGKMRKIVNNHAALIQRLNFSDKDKKSYIKSLEKNYGGIHISDYQIENDKDYYNPMTETFSFEVKNATYVINNKIYFSPMFFLKQSENPFKTQKRNYPIDFAFPFESNYYISISIPEGYTVESYPEQIKIAMNNDSNYTFLVQVTGNNIQLKVTEVQKSPIISAENYEPLKTFFQKMVDKENEQIVLKKL